MTVDLPVPRPSYQSIQPRVKFEFRRSAPPHVSCVRNLYGFDKVLRQSERIESLGIIAAPNGKTITIQQSQTQSLKGWLFHFHPSET